MIEVLLNLKVTNYCYIFVDCDNFGFYEISFIFLNWNFATKPNRKGQPRRICSKCLSKVRLIFAFRNQWNEQQAEDFSQPNQRWIVWVRMIVSSLFAVHINTTYRNDFIVMKHIGRIKMNHQKKIRVSFWKMHSWMLNIDIYFLDGPF